MRRFVTLLWLLIAIVLGVSFYGMVIKQVRRTPVPTSALPAPSLPSRKSLSAIPDNWLPYTSIQYGYSIRYPVDVTHETTSEGDLFYKLGPTQSLDTELYDGMSLTIRSRKIIAPTFLETVDEVYDMIKSNPLKPAVGPKEKVKIGSYEGITFTVESNSKRRNIYLQTDQDNYLEIIDATVEPSDREPTFRPLANLILSSLSF